MSSPPQLWWKWLLKQATASHTKLFSARTDDGQTPIDLFFRTSLFPLDWQGSRVNREAFRLRQAMSQTCDSAESLKKLHYCIQGSQQLREPSRSEDDESVNVVFNFWKRMESLLCVAFCGNITENLPNEEIMFVLAKLSWCPVLVANLVVNLFPKNETFLESRKKLNLFHLQASTMSTYECYRNQDPGCLEILCKTYPKAASSPSSNGRFPLHIALSVGKSWTEVIPLFEVFPDVLNHADPVSRLPIFCLPAIVPIEKFQIELMAKWRGNQHSAWHYLSQRYRAAALDLARCAMDLQRLGCCFELLRRNPSAIAAHKS
jgi:hypothetical protein